MRETDLINKELLYISGLFTRVVNLIPTFDITSKSILPYGLKPHTRSVSWIVEQVIVQQAKFNRRELGIKDVDFDLPDSCLHDCVVIDKTDAKFYVNVKITSSNKKTRNDISAVEKLYMQYATNPSYRLMFVVVKFSFENTTIHIDRENLHVFSPQFLPVYVNPRNDKIQSDYYAAPIERGRKKYLDELKKCSKSIVLK